MVEDYVQSISEDIIQKRNYVILDNATQGLEISEKKCMFIKSSGLGFSILELHNLEKYSKDELEEEIRQKKVNMDNILDSPVEYRILKVFISNEDLSDDVVELIKSSHMHNVSMKKFVKPIYINLAKRQLECCFEGKFPDDGIILILKEKLSLKIWKAYNEEHIKKINKEKTKEYTIDFSSKRAIAVYTFIILNIFIYIVAKLQCVAYRADYFDIMIKFGMKDNELIRQGQYYRLLAPIFLHAGIVHLAVNCYSIYIIGKFCEKLYGNLKFLLIYILSGVAGCIASFALTSSLSLGASGAIFGILGALVYFGTQKPLVYKMLFGSSVVGVIILNLMVGFFTTGIDNYGHIGGLIAGFLLAGIFRYRKEDKWYIRTICLIFLVAIYGGMLYMGFNNMGGR